MKTEHNCDAVRTITKVLSKTPFYRVQTELMGARR